MVTEGLFWPIVKIPFDCRGPLSGSGYWSFNDGCSVATLTEQEFETPISLWLENLLLARDSSDAPFLETSADLKS
jgi:hypothetical protein